MREARDAEHEEDAKRRSNNFLQAMGSPGGEQTGKFSREDGGRRHGKELAPATSHAADEVTPPKHRA